MIDREKVIKGLKHCAEKQDTIVNKNHGFNCIQCPYFRKCENIGALVGLPLMRDALKLLQAQEPETLDAPTVDAIPVEWLKGLMLSTEDDVDNVEFAWIMREWQNEQEA